MQELRKTGQQLKKDTESIGHELKDVAEEQATTASDIGHASEQETSPAEKNP
jgi:hypothetical protein